MAIDDIHQSRRLGLCLEVNEAFEKLFGYTLKETRNLNQWFRRAFPEPKYRKKIIQEWLQDIRWARRNGGVMPMAEDRVRTKDGRDLVVEVGGVILGDHLLTTFVDRTKRIKAEQQLAQSESKFRQFFEQLPLPAVHVEFGKKHETNRFLGMNRAFHEKFGYSAKELRTLGDWLKRAYPDPKYRREANEIWFRAVEQSMKTGKFIEAHDYQMRCKDGRKLVVATTGVLLEQSLLVVGLDRTELRKAEQRMKQMAQQETERLQQKLQTSVVASAVAHEVNQPLSEILLKSQLALQRANSLPGFCPKLHAILHGIVEDSRRVERTIERMRALLRNVPIQRVSMDLRDVVDSSLLYLKRGLIDAGIEVEARVPGRPVQIFGDTSQLQLAVSNLLRNAKEAIDENRSAVRKIRIQLSSSSTHAEICVMDSGPGLAPELRQEVFSLLTSNRPKGMGLGLYLVRTTVVNHGGEVRLEESPLGGAQFRLRIPLEREERKTKK